MQARARFEYNSFGSLRGFYLEKESKKRGGVPRPLMVRWHVKEDSRVLVYFPNGVVRYMERSELLDGFGSRGLTGDDEVAAAWHAELNNEAARKRGQRDLSMLTGRLVPYWNDIIDAVCGDAKEAQVQVIKASEFPGGGSGVGQELVGLQISKKGGERLLELEESQRG